MYNKFMPRTFPETLHLLCEVRGGRYMKGENINQRYVAQLAEVSQPTIGRWIKGQTLPRMEELKKLCDAFGVNASQMLGEIPIPRIDISSNATAEDEKFIREYLSQSEKIRHHVRETMNSTYRLIRENEENGAAR